MNRFYHDLEIEVLLLQEEDIVRTSPNQFDDVKDDPFHPGDSTFG